MTCLSPDSFYYDTSRRNIIHNTHAAFEEAAMIAFRELCDEFKEDENWMNWYASAVLYSDYFMKWGSRVAALMIYYQILYIQNLLYLQKKDSLANQATFKAI